MSACFRPWTALALWPALAVPPAAADLSSCSWTQGFSYENLNGVVRALVVFDDGSGPALWTSGELLFSGGLPSGRVARFACGSLFADGFETGDTSGWSQVMQ